jgi:hypothetical protein
MSLALQHVVLESEYEIDTKLCCIDVADDKYVTVPKVDNFQGIHILLTLQVVRNYVPVNSRQHYFRTSSRGADVISSLTVDDFFPIFCFPRRPFITASNSRLCSS